MASHHTHILCRAVPFTKPHFLCRLYLATLDMITKANRSSASLQSLSAWAMIRFFSSLLGLFWRVCCSVVGIVDSIFDVLLQPCNPTVCFFFSHLSAASAFSPEPPPLLLFCLQRGQRGARGLVRSVPPLLYARRPPRKCFPSMNLRSLFFVFVPIGFFLLSPVWFLIAGFFQCVVAATASDKTGTRVSIFSCCRLRSNLRPCFL